MGIYINHIKGVSVTTQKQALLRVCASCEWVFKYKSKVEEDVTNALVEGYIYEAKCCPKCQFVTYGARSVYGDQCYRYAETQKPWMKKKMDALWASLYREIQNDKQGRTPLDFFKE